MALLATLLWTIFLFLGRFAYQNLTHWFWGIYEQICVSKSWTYTSANSAKLFIICIYSLILFNTASWKLESVASIFWLYFQFAMFIPSARCGICLECESLRASPEYLWLAVWPPYSSFFFLEGNNIPAKQCLVFLERSWARFGMFVSKSLMFACAHFVCELSYTSSHTKIFLIRNSHPIYWGVYTTNLLRDGCGVWEARGAGGT